MQRQTKLAAALAIALSVAAASLPAANLTVTSCADVGAGSLRETVAGAVSGDTIVFDTVSMNCSKITLATGAIATPLDDLTLSGPGVASLGIEGTGTGRVLSHYGNGTLTVQGLTLSHVSYATVSGTCIFGKNVVLSDAVLYGCFGYGQAPGTLKGGGVYATGDLHMRSSTISHCGVFPALAPASDAVGAGAYVVGNADIQFSTITNNYNLVGSNGGGLVVLGDATIANSTFSNNAGGGLTVRGPAGSVLIANSTVSGNSGSICGGVNSTRPMTLANSTVAFNTSFQASIGGIPYADGICANISLDLQSSIVANNMANGAAGDLSTLAGTAVNGANSLIMATSAGTTAPAGTQNSDPLLGPLANNGGPTLTRALQPGSPALASGNNAARLGYDQRGPGFARMTGEHVDIGAVQSGDGIFANGFE